MSLEVRNLVKKYGDKVVLNHLSFEMKEPGVYALLGTNGAGKTTSLRIILGMLSYDEGEVLWEGKPFQPLSENIGYLAEERGLYPKYNTVEIPAIITPATIPFSAEFMVEESCC